MLGPCPFTGTVFDLEIIFPIPGNYALGNLSGAGGLGVSYTGRSDIDPPQELKARIETQRYKYFKYSSADTPVAAFLKECKNYHDFDSPRDKIHHDSPDSEDFASPFCK